MNHQLVHQELAERAAKLLAQLPAVDPVAVLLQQQRIILSGQVPGAPLADGVLAHRNLGLQQLIQQALSYQHRLANGEGQQTQAAARAVCQELERLLHNKAQRRAALESTGDALLSSRMFVSIDVAQRVRGSPERYKAIGPTAILVNWLRSLDKSIPYGRQLVGAVPGKELMAEHGIGFRESVALGVLFQARYRAINRAFTDFDPAQAIELAAGLSPRGLHLTRDFPSLAYIETDLPDVIAEKVSAASAIVQASRSRGGFMRFEAVEASNTAEVLALLNRLRDDQRTAIISEGLLVYLNREELTAFATTMREALQGADRVWIADIVTQENLRQLFANHPRVADAVRSVFRSTNRQIVRDNPFPDDHAATSFFTELGLRVVSTVPLADFVKERKVWIPVASWQEEMVRLVGSRQIWVLAGQG